MRKISKAFFTGLAAILPVAITIYLVCWLGKAAEVAFKGMRDIAFPMVPYVPGMGVVAGLVVVFVVGLSLRVWVVRKLFGLGESLLNRMPVVRAIYGAARDLIGFFSQAKERALSQVVLVKVGETDMRQIGFITREDFSGCPKGMATDDTVAVYLPSSYEVGGVTVLVSRSAVRPIEMSFEEAIRFALTAGMSSGEKGKA